MSRALVIPLCFVFGVLVLWQGLVVGLAIPEYLLPAPLVIVEKLDRSLLTEVAYTAGEALCGFAIASVLAFAGLGDAQMDWIIPIRPELVQARDQQTITFDHHLGIAQRQRQAAEEETERAFAPGILADLRCHGRSRP